MNNLLLIGAEYNYPKRCKRDPYRARFCTKVTGVRVFWATLEGKNRWAQNMPFKVKLFHKIHSMVHHGMIGGESPAWQRAAKRLESKMPQFEYQKEWY